MALYNYHHALHQLPVYLYSPFSSHLVLEWPNAHLHKKPVNGACHQKPKKVFRPRVLRASRES